MTDLFLDILNASYAASFVVLAVILARLLLKKAPRWMVCALWVLVAVRLLVPGVLETSFSMVPSTEIIPPQSLYDTAPQIQSGFTAIDDVVNPVYSESLQPTPGASVNPLQVWLAIFANVWFLGAVAMSIWAAVSSIRVRRRLRERVRVDGNIFLCDGIESPFIFGLFRPMICLPGDLGEDAKHHVIAHERAHLRRRDHWWKPLGFALLTVNWFNPLIWVAYILLCRDIEMACDERVVRDLSPEEKKAYSAALLACSVNPRHITACPLAFGEVGVKQRIKSVLSYKKPAFWVILVTVIVGIALAAGLLTNPKSGDPEIRWDNVLYIQEGKILRERPEDAVAVGTLKNIVNVEVGEPEYYHPDENGEAAHLDVAYIGSPIWMAGDTLYLMEPGGDRWLPFVPKHSPADAADLLKGDVQCNFILRGDTVSIKEFLSGDGELALRELLAAAAQQAQPTMDWTWEMAISGNYVEDICFVIDKLDFTHHALLTRREEGWQLVYRDDTLAVSAWRFQSPELDAFIAPWNTDLALATEQFSPFATEDNPIFVEYHTAALPQVSLRVGVPEVHIGPDVTETYVEYQSSVSYTENTIEIQCRPLGRADWLHIQYFDHTEVLFGTPPQYQSIVLENGILYHTGDPSRWERIWLDSPRGQVVVTMDPNTDWSTADYEMALAIVNTLQIAVPEASGMVQTIDVKDVTFTVQPPQGWETEPFSGSNYMGFRFREQGCEDWTKVTFWPNWVTMYKYTGTVEPRTFPSGLVSEVYYLPNSAPYEWHFVYFYDAFSSMIVEKPDDCTWDEHTYKEILDIIGTITISRNGEALFTSLPYQEGVEDPLGLSASLENVTPRGANLVIEQDGTLWDEIITGSNWMLEQKVDGRWVSIMPESTVWTTEAYLLTAGSTRSFPINWVSLVGELGPGEYRVGKHFTGERRPMFTLSIEKETQEQMVWAEFTIE